jgi:hypothetical protein
MSFALGCEMSDVFRVIRPMSVLVYSDTGRKGTGPSDPRTEWTCCPPIAHIPTPLAPRSLGRPSGGSCKTTALPSSSPRAAVTEARAGRSSQQPS